MDCVHEFLRKCKDKLKMANEYLSQIGAGVERGQNEIPCLSGGKQSNGRFPKREQSSGFVSDRCFVRNFAVGAGVCRPREKKQKTMKKIVVFTGAGVSADSGIATFRDSDGLWANYRIEDVCTPEALRCNRETVIGFYNQRRKELLEKRANPAHIALASLEEKYRVEVITQNIDDLHERAGSTRITHLHGELSKLRSMDNDDAIYPIAGWREAVQAIESGKETSEDYVTVWKQEIDAKGSDGALLRPHVVFFGEQVPNYDLACRIASTADLFIVCGTSLAVYPAASLLFSVKSGVPVYLVDPNRPNLHHVDNPIQFIQKRAAEGMPELCRQLLQEA